MNILFGVILILLLQINTNGESRSCEDSITLIINKKIDMIKLGAHLTSVINNGQVKWPSCDVITKNKTNVKNSDNVLTAMYWIKNYIIRDDLSNKDSIIFLIDMSNGDDWAINRTIDDGRYCHFIDGRSITLLMEVDFSITDTTSIFVNIQKNIEKYVRYNFLGKRWEIINADTTQVDVVVHVNGFNFPKEMNADIKIWTNGQLLIVDFPKIRKPYVDKFGLSIRKTIGGIPANSPQPFKRFRYNDNIDMKEEFYKIFPWINDSLKIWKRNFENGGAEVIVK
jgi:hypothetical protein